jgi:hypothetical protein
VEDDLTNAPEAALPPPAVRVPSIYFNGFQLGLSNADITLLALLDNEPTLKINLSFTVAKSLLDKLQTLMSVLEENTGREIMTTDDVAKGLEGLKGMVD